MRQGDSFTLFLAFMLTIIVMIIMMVVYHFIAPPPMTGYIADKEHYPAYFPTDDPTPEVFVLVITDDSGKRYVSWIVSEERWNLYEIGDRVEWLPRFKKEDA